MDSKKSKNENGDVRKGPLWSREVERAWIWVVAMELTIVPSCFPLYTPSIEGQPVRKWVPSP